MYSQVCGWNWCVASLGSQVYFAEARKGVLCVGWVCVCGRGGVQEGRVVPMTGLEATERSGLFPVSAGKPLKVLKECQGVVRSMCPLSLFPWLPAQ